MYLLRLPKILRLFLSHAIYENNKSIDPTIYLTFDDGPIPNITEWVLDLLNKYEAKATFFLVGDNVSKHPHIYQKIIDNHHTIGNHTYHHLKGSDTSCNVYISDVLKAANCINSSLFRPPYGRIKPSQSRALRKKGYQLVLWSLLSGDFDEKISPKQCLENVLLRIKPNDVVVFHDSIKAYKRLEFVLPRLLSYCKNKGWKMDKIEL